MYTTKYKSSIHYILIRRPTVTYPTDTNHMRTAHRKTQLPQPPYYTDVLLLSYYTDDIDVRCPIVCRRTPVAALRAIAAVSP